MGMVFRRKYRAKSGTIRQCATWTIKYYQGGRPVQERTRTTKKGEALQLLKKREGAVAEGRPVSPRYDRLKFEDAVKDVVLDYTTNRKRSADGVERRIALHLKPFFGTYRMVEVTASLLRRYIAHRQQANAANATINREMAVVRRAFTLAVRENRLGTKPHFPMLAEDNVRKGFFEREQFEAVRDHLPEALRGLVTVAVHSGWRIRSELLPLTWSQVDRKVGTIRLEPGTTKNRHGRTFVYDEIPELRDVVEEQWAAHEQLKAGGRICPYVFHRSGQPIREFVRAWRSACTKAGCPGRIVHDLRRTAVRNLVRAGVSEQTAMKVTGHITASVFRRYDIVAESDMREASRKLARRADGDSRGDSGRSAANPARTASS